MLHRAEIVSAAHAKIKAGESPDLMEESSWFAPGGGEEVGRFPVAVAGRAGLAAEKHQLAGLPAVYGDLDGHLLAAADHGSVDLDQQEDAGRPRQLGRGIDKTPSQLQHSPWVQESGGKGQDAGDAGEKESSRGGPCGQELVDFYLRAAPGRVGGQGLKQLARAAVLELRPGPGKLDQAQQGAFEAGISSLYFASVSQQGSWAKQGQEHEESKGRAGRDQDDPGDGESSRCLQ